MAIESDRLTDRETDRGETVSQLVRQSTPT